VLESGKTAIPDLQRPEIAKIRAISGTGILEQWYTRRIGHHARGHDPSPGEP
jgi:hypothetical protein